MTADTISATTSSGVQDICDTLCDVPQVNLSASGEPVATEVSQHVLGVQGELRAERLAGEDAIIALSLLMFCLVAYVVGSSKYFLMYRLKEFFSRKRTYAGAEAEVNRREVSNTIILTSVSCVSLGLILCDRIMESGRMDALFDGGNMWSMWCVFGIVMAVVVGLLLLKTLVYSFVNGVFFRREECAKWTSSFFLLCSLVSLLLLPLALVEIYSPANGAFVTYCLLAVLFLCEISIFYRLCVNFKTKKEGHLLIFLYFCSVEIMPLLVIGQFCRNVL